jgi:hypothetical protein
MCDARTPRRGRTSGRGERELSRRPGPTLRVLSAFETRSTRTRSKRGGSRCACGSRGDGGEGPSVVMRQRVHEVLALRRRRFEEPVPPVDLPGDERAAVSRRGSRVPGSPKSTKLSRFANQSSCSP